MLTAREMTSASSAKPVSVWHAMRAFAGLLRGITSVRLNGIMFEGERYAW